MTADGDGSHEIKRHLLLGRKAMTNLDSILKSRDITLLLWLFSFIFISWRLITLQYCSCFCHILT